MISRKIIIFLLFVSTVVIPFTQILAEEPGNVQKIDITAGSYYFRPERISVRMNVPVEISISRESGIVPHSFVMHSPEAGMEFNISLSSDAQIVRFMPVRTGEFPFYCDHKLLFMKSHRARGMEGIIEVKE